MEENIKTEIYWITLHATVRRYVKSWDACQFNKVTKCKFGNLPAKLAEVLPWKIIYVNVIGPYTIKVTKNFKLDIICLTMIQPATSWF